MKLSRLGGETFVCFLTLTLTLSLSLQLSLPFYLSFSQEKCFRVRMRMGLESHPKEKVKVDCRMMRKSWDIVQLFTFDGQSYWLKWLSSGFGMAG